jgi:Kef-type K+ transport system membrane component KefB
VASAAVEDVIAWAILAVTLAFAGLGNALPSTAVIGLSVTFALVMLLALRPGAHRLVHLVERRPDAERILLPIVLVGALAAATATQAIGIHAIFGAFLFGVIMPRRTRTSAVLATRIRSFTMAALLPLFFASVGMHVSIGAVGGSPAAWTGPLVLIAVAMATKLAGAALSARWTGMTWRNAYRIGVLMNCRGLTGIVVAQVGLQKGVIDERMFTVLVLTALITTAVTVPLLSLAGEFGTAPGRAAPSPAPSRPEPVAGSAEHTTEPNGSFR